MMKDRSFNLIHGEKLTSLEKRTFPRFPLGQMTAKIGNLVCEVVNISYTGAQLRHRHISELVSNQQRQKGYFHWLGEELAFQADLKWSQDFYGGLEFVVDKNFSKQLAHFLSLDRLIQSIRPVDGESLGLELPQDLKLWLRGEGPVEIFIWAHRDGEIARFQLMSLTDYLEWEDGLGLRSGVVLTQKAKDGLLFDEKELEISWDMAIDSKRVDFMGMILDRLNSNLINQTMLNFLKLKIGR